MGLTHQTSLGATHRGLPRRARKLLPITPGGPTGPYCGNKLSVGFLYPQRVRRQIPVDTEVQPLLGIRGSPWPNGLWGLDQPG